MKTMVFPLWLSAVMARTELEQPSVPSAWIDRETARNRVSLRTLQASFGEMIRSCATQLNDNKVADAASKKRIIKYLRISKENQMAKTSA